MTATSVRVPLRPFRREPVLRFESRGSRPVSIYGGQLAFLRYTQGRELLRAAEVLAWFGSSIGQRSFVPPDAIAVQNELLFQTVVRRPRPR